MTAISVKKQYFVWESGCLVYCCCHHNTRMHIRQSPQFSGMHICHHKNRSLVVMPAIISSVRSRGLKEQLTRSTPKSAELCHQASNKFKVRHEQLSNCIYEAFHLGPNNAVATNWWNDSLPRLCGQVMGSGHARCTIHNTQFRWHMDTIRKPNKANLVRSFSCEDGMVWTITANVIEWFVEY